jgi:hypothetical protein
MFVLIEATNVLTNTYVPHGMSNVTKVTRTLAYNYVPHGMFNVTKTLTYNYVPPCMSYVINMTSVTKTVRSKHDWGTPLRTLTKDSLQGTQILFFFTFSITYLRFPLFFRVK